ncbi:hypothetical protein QTN47_17030 [Danxiaibacter flavus]|uniref:Uncharacterized protein n=1 Tax=Danxiaibacter flavus TaxID=3049108 RepID=A0ABV3ZH48_9BACT|nr:hypothetical protein QNM32_17040 [Chitinophagaceae bacterium DXS]
MSYEITTPKASFVQFSGVPQRDSLEAFGFTLPEYDKFNAAFQFGIMDSATKGYTVPTTMELWVSICTTSGTLIAKLNQPTLLETAVKFTMPSTNIVLKSIKYGDFTREYSSPSVNKAGLSAVLLSDFGIDSDPVNMVAYCGAPDLVISYMNGVIISQLASVRTYKTLYADANTAIQSLVKPGKCYCYCIADGPGAVLDRSNVFTRSTTARFITQLRYRNNEDAFGFTYPVSTVYNRVSLPLYLKGMQPLFTKKLYRKSNGKNLVLSAQMDKQVEVTTDWMPEFYHECLSLALIHDQVEFLESNSWIGYVIDQDYKIEWDENAVDRGLGSAKLKTQTYNYSNDNCS